MKQLLFTLLFASGLSFSQPLLHTNELVLSVETPMNCVTEPSSCSTDQTALTTQLISGTVGDVQASAVAKLSGKEGKLGGQAWFKVNKNTWLGGSSVTNLHFEMEHALYVALQGQFGAYEVFPFIIAELRDEALGGAGIKIYTPQLITLELEWKTSAKYMTNTIIFSAGFVISPKILDKIKTQFGIK